MDEQPPSFLRAVDALYDQAGTQWPRFSEEWYWDVLFQARKHVYKSTFAEAGGEHPLIGAKDRNLSQTAREECEQLGLVEEGPIDIPGAAVALHSLQGAPHLNGANGRVLPPSGRGASEQPSTPGRIPVRLVSGQVVACKLSNLKSASGRAPMPSIPDTVAPAASMPSHASEASMAARAAAAAATGPRATSTRSAASTPPLEPLTGPLADLVWADIRQGHVAPILSRDTLLSGGLQEYKITCSTCGWFGSEFHIALKRTVPYSLSPVRDSVRLECIDCLVRAAHAAGVRPTKKAVEKFVDGRMMGSVEAVSILNGFGFMNWGGGGPAWASAQAEYTASGGIGMVPNHGVLY